MEFYDLYTRMYTVFIRLCVMSVAEERLPASHKICKSIQFVMCVMQNSTKHNFQFVPERK